MTSNSFEPMTRLEGQSRRKMSITIGLILAFLVVSFYAVTLVRLKGNLVKRAELQTGASTSAGQSSAPSTTKTTQGQ